MSYDDDYDDEDETIGQKLRRMIDEMTGKTRIRKLEQDLEWEKDRTKYAERKMREFAKRIIELEDKYENPQRWSHGAYCSIGLCPDPCGKKPYCGTEKPHKECNGVVGCGCHCHNSGTPFQVATGQENVR